MEFKEFPKIPRMKRDVTVTEKLDGTNGVVFVDVLQEGLPSGTYVPALNLVVSAGSRTRWITPEDDNFGFARWVSENAAELARLGPGLHYGEWWGSGIQRGYGMPKGQRKFSLFNTARWSDPTARPACCDVTPVLYQGVFDTFMITMTLLDLIRSGSRAVPGFMDPEGIVIFHHAANICFKQTIERDEEPKSVAKPKVTRAPKDPSKGGRRKEQLPFEGNDRRKGPMQVGYARAVSGVQPAFEAGYGTQS